MTLDQRRMATLFWIAWNNRPHWHRTRLEGGLAVYLRVSANAVLTLLVRRVGQTATAEDWERVLDDYGYPLPERRPEPVWNEKAHGLMAMWEHPAATFYRERLGLASPLAPSVSHE